MAQSIRTRTVLAAFLLAWASTAFAQGTVMVSPIFTALDINGNAGVGFKLCSYFAGTTTPQNTYNDAALTVPNSQPVVMDAAGRAVIFLNSGAFYKFVLRSAGSDTTCSTGTVQWTVDNVGATPTSSGNLDALGTAGEAITAGNAIYLSDGSGGRTAGQWYKTDATNPYSSTTGPIGMAPNAIASATAGTIRLSGQMTGLTGLTPGLTYYLSATTAGAVTSTAPSNNQRAVGRADSTSTIILSANPAVSPVDVRRCDGRLTLTTGTPITTADVTAATTLFFTPYQGNRCTLYDGTSWTVRTFAEVSIAVPATTATMYDVWFFDNAGTLALELLAWTNDTTRATALASQDGVRVKSGATTRRYLGSMRTTAVSGQTEDSRSKRLVWNDQHRVRRPLLRTESSVSWAYTLATWRAARADATNQVQAIVGVSETPLFLSLQVNAANDANAIVMVAIGVDSTTTPLQTQGLITGLGSSLPNTAWASYDYFPTVGYHAYTWLEFSTAAGTTTWYGQLSAGFPGGIRGWVEG